MTDEKWPMLSLHPVFVYAQWGCISHTPPKNKNLLLYFDYFGVNIINKYMNVYYKYSILYIEEYRYLGIIFPAMT